MMTRICIVGLGYIGLPTAVMLANAGHDVVGVDVDPKIVENTNHGVTTIKEDDFNGLFQKARATGRLKAQASVSEAEVFLICVPTPFSKDDDSKTLAYVKEAAAEIVKVLRPGNLVILESTVPPGTTVGPLRAALEAGGLKAGADFHLAYCPERLLPGNLVHEIIHNDKIVGGVDMRSAEMGAEIYRSFVRGQIVLTDATTAEFVKIAENTFGAVNIGMANEMSRMCENLGINVREALELANLHPRVNFMHPGPGVGGHCVPVDPWFLVKADGENSTVIRRALEVNEAQPGHVFDLVRSALEEAGLSVSGAKVVVLGVAYKKNVNDSRESPAIPLISALQQAGASVVACDPVVTEFLVPVVSDIASACEGADALVLITDHDVFSGINFNSLAVRNKVLVDTRNMFEKPDGFVFRQLGVGRQ